VKLELELKLKLGWFGSPGHKLTGEYNKYNGEYYNEAVQCGGKRGESVMVEIDKGCVDHVQIFEIEVHGRRYFDLIEIGLESAKQSSTWNSADFAIDNDLASSTCTTKEYNPWIRVYFKSSSNVGKVMIEAGQGYKATCIYSVSVIEEDVKSLCGTYTGKAYGPYYNETVQCDGKRGESVMIQIGGCGSKESLRLFEIKAYFDRGNIRNPDAHHCVHVSLSNIQTDRQRSHITLCTSPCQVC